VSDVRERRWDTDERGRGVADAAALAPWVDELRELVMTADWVAEEPEVHLLPHLERLVAAEPDLTLAATRVAGGVLEIDVELAALAPPRGLREIAYRLVGAISEGVTLVREIGEDGATFDVVTGTPPGTTPFATHGHTLRFRIRQ
jgi:hypothetical protein